MKKASFLFLTIFWASIQIFAQEITNLNELIQKEELIEKELLVLTSGESESERLKASEQIFKTLGEAFQLDPELKYPFPKLKNIPILISTDQKMRIVTWNVYFENGTYQYFGYIQYKKDKNKTLLLPLKDASATIETPEKEILGNQNWFGALYYDLIEIADKSKSYYTLLGWDGNDLFSNKKVIDVLYFTSSGQAKFGHPIFIRQGRAAKRIIFEYSKTASLTLKYDKNLQAIVFERLVPSKPTFEGNFRFYVTDVTTDGLILEKDKKWHFVEDIQSKNDKTQPLKNRKTQKNYKN